MSSTPTTREQPDPRHQHNEDRQLHHADVEHDEILGEARPSATGLDARRFAPPRLPAVPLSHLGESVDVSLTWRIEVPRARVWQCLTDPDLLIQWLGALVTGEVSAESEFVVDHGDDYCCRSTVTTCAEPTRLEFTWHFPDEPPSKVAFGLDESEGTTTLRLSHSSLGDLADSYRDGWCVHLSYLEAAALGTPLPLSMFWQLHGTVAQLNLR